MQEESEESMVVQQLFCMKSRPRSVEGQKGVATIDDRTTPVGGWNRSSTELCFLPATTSPKTIGETRQQIMREAKTEHARRSVDAKKYEML